MGDISNETSMEDILSSIKRIIAEEGDASMTSVRSRRPVRSAPRQPEPAPFPDDSDILDLNAFPAPDAPRQPRESAAVEERVTMTETAEARAAVDAILSERAAAATSRSLESLSKLVVQPTVSGKDTLEDLVRDMLKPMLRDWLDANLPVMVETMVAREISRIAGRNR